MWFTRLAILRPILIGMLFAAFVVLGLRSMGSIPAELNPRVEIPTLLVTTVFPGAGPEEVENLISKPLEDSVATVSRVKDIFSSSQESLSVVTLDFAIGTPLDEALAAVRERVEAAKLELPDGAHSPVVSKLDLNALPVMTIALTGGDNVETLRSLAEDQVKYYLDRVPGVASVQVRGGARREIQVAVERDRLQTYGMSLSDVMNSLRAASINVPAGNISDGVREYGVRAVGEFNSLDAIRNVPLSLPPSGSSLAALGGGAALPGMQMPPATPGTPLTLGEIATVRDTVAAPDTITRMDGKPSVSLVINKAADANTVQIADGVRQVLSRLKSELPLGVHLVVDQDQSQLVRGALEDVNSSLLLGALLAILVVYLFLHNLRGTAIVSIAIPVSIISTFLVMWAAGFTFNQMTLLGLSLSVGILVDDSILVLESIYRHLHGGEMPRDAAFNGRNEISMADITNTLVDVVVFVPIAFMGGIVGQFFREFGVVVASASLFSLLVSLSLTPMLASRLYRQDEALEARRGIFAHFDRFYRSLDAAYRRLLIMALHRRPLVIGSGALALLFSGVLAWRTLAFEFIPPFDQSRISVSMTAPAGSSLTATDALLRQVEDTARKIPEVVHCSAEAGSISAGFGSLMLQGPQYGQVTLTLREKQGLADRVLHPFGGGPARRTRSDDGIAAELRVALADLS
ncbi:MAG TPA: efflux RND transporter permease subunit, partial [Armatimonadota bacterium]|nr:efflux RND transporter permease subunit [Armatimonadota bacterium]